MSHMSLKELQSLFSTEYARFIFLNQSEDLELDLSDDEDEDDDCSSCCDDESCEDDDCMDDEEGMIDPNEYAIYFSVLRLVTYFQAIVEKVYLASESNKELDFESIMKWAVDKKYIKNNHDVETLAILFTFVHETVSAVPTNDLVCYTQDRERLPLLSPDHFVQSIEILSLIVQTITKER